MADTNLQTPESTGAVDNSQPDLFPEDGAGQSDLAQQLAMVSPEELAALAAGLDPDVKMNLAQALFATLTPEQKQAMDTTPSGDVVDNMQQAAPEKAELQYQMSITRSQKRCASTPGMITLAKDHLAKWNQRLDSLIEDGFMDETEAAKHRKNLDPEGENRFSIVLENRGFLRDTCTVIEALEKARAGQAQLSKSVLQGATTKFSTSKPVPRPADPADGQVDVKAAEEIGSRLAKL